MDFSIILIGILVVAIILIGISIYVKYLIKKEIKKTTEQ